MIFRRRHVRTRRRPTCPSLVRNCCKIFVHCLTDNGMPRRSPRRRSSKRRSGSRRRRNYRSTDCNEWTCTPVEGLNTLHDCHVNPSDKYTVSVTQHDAMIGSKEDLSRRLQLLELTMNLYREHGIQTDSLETIIPSLTRDFASAIHYLRHPNDIKTYLRDDDEDESMDSSLYERFERLSLSPAPFSASPDAPSSVSTDYVPFTPGTR